MTSPVVTRAQAGLVLADTARLADPDGVTLHYGGGALGGFLWDHARCATVWRLWQRYHMSKGWADIAYSEGVCPHGFIFEGRGKGHRTAAQGTNEGNSRSLAICYIAGGDEPLTDAAKVAIVDAIAMLGLTGRHVWVHREWHTTDCPGTALVQWRNDGLQLPAPPAPPPAPTPPPAEPVGIVAMASTPAGDGYIEVDAHGGVFTFGAAGFYGSLPGIPLVPNHDIVAAAISPSGGGYWLAASDGGVFSFGDARYMGGLGAITLNAPIRGFTVLPGGDGYRMVAEDGGVFCFGAATYEGSVTL